ncbi:MAG: hypothetical protein ACLU6W_01275 [Lachnospiraceae bacterium]|nr:hypothetical protein [Candidatus Fimimorpha excrementavium]
MKKVVIGIASGSGLKHVFFLLAALIAGAAGRELEIVLVSMDKDRESPQHVQMEQTVKRFRKIIKKLPPGYQISIRYEYDDIMKDRLGEFTEDTTMEELLPKEDVKILKDLCTDEELKTKPANGYYGKPAVGDLANHMTSRMDREWKIIEEIRSGLRRYDTIYIAIGSSFGGQGSNEVLNTVKQVAETFEKSRKEDTNGHRLFIYCIYILPYFTWEYREGHSIIAYVFWPNAAENLKSNWKKIWPDFQAMEHGISVLDGLALPGTVGLDEITDEYSEAKGQDRHFHVMDMAIANEVIHFINQDLPKPGRGQRPIYQEEWLMDGVEHVEWTTIFEGNSDTGRAFIRGFRFFVCVYILLKYLVKSDDMEREVIFDRIYGKELFKRSVRARNYLEQNREIMVTLRKIFGEMMELAEDMLGALADLCQSSRLGHTAPVTELADAERIIRILKEESADLDTKLDEIILVDEAYEKTSLTVRAVHNWICDQIQIGRGRNETPEKTAAFLFGKVYEAVKQAETGTL